MQDTHLEQHIEALKSAIYSWAQQHDLWFDSGFKSWMEHYDDEPSDTPCVLLLWSDGSLGRILDGYHSSELLNEFNELIWNCGYYHKLEESGIASLWVTDNDELEEAYRDYFEWQWICDLIQPDFSNLYEEIYEWFQTHPDDLYNLEPRRFEILLDGIFRNNGYRTQLSSGQADGGVDLRLYSNDVISEAVTLVQARRYAKSNPIRLEAVQALSAAVEDERANRGLFVTTSRYLPCAERFAARQNRRIQLATSNDVSCWSSCAVERLIQDKSRLVSPDHVKSLLNSKSTSNTLGGKIFHANTGYTMVKNTFALVLRESGGAALLMKLPKTSVSGDSFQGYEVPDMVTASLDYLDAKNVFRAKKKYNDNENLYLWGDRNLYSPWDGTPQYYDHYD